MRPDVGVTLVDPLPADSLGQSLDRLGRDRQIGQFGKISGCLLIGHAVHASVEDLLLYAGTEARAINTQ